MVSYMTQAAGQLPGNVIYPGTEFGFRSPFDVMRHNMDFGNVKIDSKTGRVRFQMKTTEDAVTQLVQHMRSLDFEEVSALFICENLSRQSREIDLASLLSEYFDEVVIVKVTRKQDDLLASTIMQFTKKWDSEYPPSLNPKHYTTWGRTPDYMNYAESLSHWQAVQATLPKVRYEFVPYLSSDPGTEDLTHRFFTAVDFPDMPKGILKPHKRINSGLDAATIKKLVFIKKLGRTFASVPKIETFLHTKFKAAIEQGRRDVEKASRAGGAHTQPPVWRMKPRDRKRILDHYHPSNSAFFEQVEKNGITADWDAWASEIGIAEAAR